MLRLTNCERVDITIRKHDLWFAGVLVRQDKPRLQKRIRVGWLAAQGPEEAGRSPQSLRGERLHEKVRGSHTRGIATRIARRWSGGSEVNEIT